MSNPFFSNCGPFYISEILKLLDINSEIKEKHKVKDIVDLFNAEKGCITFFHSKKYNEIAKKTKASFCITTKNLKDYLPDNCSAIIVDNVCLPPFSSSPSPSLGRWCLCHHQCSHPHPAVAVSTRLTQS